MNKHIMLDIETLGTAPGASIVCVAYVEFDPTRGDAKTATPEDIERAIGAGHILHIDLESNHLAGLHIEPSTLQWWMHQPDAARMATFGETIMATRLFDVLVDLRTRFDVIRGLNNELRVWAKSPQFDCVLVEAACRKLNLKAPWHYREPRDLRTLIDCAGLLPEELTKPTVEHSALEDAKAQARDAVKAMWAIGGQSW